MMEVFPTPWSPRKTILNFVVFRLLFDEVMLIILYISFIIVRLIFLGLDLALELLSNIL